MRLALLLLAFVLGSALAQDAPKKKSKPAAKKTTTQVTAKAHQKPTPEQIRKFNELQKKQQ